MAIISAIVFSQNISAQKDLSINEVFSRYGKQKNVVMVNISGEMLEDYEGVV